MVQAAARLSRTQTHRRPHRQPSSRQAEVAAMKEEQQSAEQDYNEARGQRRSGNGKGGQQRFQLHAFDTITISTTPNYLVMGILPRVGLVVVWGPPKCGKSFWTFDLVMHVALGWQYRGRKVRQGPVVYCAVEGGYGFRYRIEAWRQRHLAE